VKETSIGQPITCDSMGSTHLDFIEFESRLWMYITRGPDSKGMALDKAKVSALHELTGNWLYDHREDPHVSLEYMMGYGLCGMLEYDIQQIGGVPNREDIYHITQNVLKFIAANVSEDALREIKQVVAEKRRIELEVEDAKRSVAEVGKKVDAWWTSKDQSNG
jgi:hypothetical protein